VDRVHGATALVRLAAHPAAATGLAEDDVLVFGVADSAHGRVALPVQLAQFARGHAHCHVGAVAALDLQAGAGGAGQLGALARHHLYRVDDAADGDEAQRQGVACHRLGLRAADDLAADRDALGRQDVALLAVDVVQQGDVGAAVGVVLDCGDLGRHALLLAAPEVDAAVAALVAAAAEARRDAATVVTPTGLLERLD